MAYRLGDYDFRRRCERDTFRTWQGAQFRSERAPESLECRQRIGAVPEIEVTAHQTLVHCFDQVVRRQAARVPRERFAETLLRFELSCLLADKAIEAVV